MCSIIDRFAECSAELLKRLCLRKKEKRDMYRWENSLHFSISSDKHRRLIVRYPCVAWNETTVREEW